VELWPIAHVGVLVRVLLSVASKGSELLGYLGGNSTLYSLDSPSKCHFRTYCFYVVPAATSSPQTELGFALKLIKKQLALCRLQRNMDFDLETQ